MKTVRTAEELADALGLQPGDTVTIRTPQFERPANWEKPKAAPTTPEQWESLRYCTKEELTALGLGNWDDSLMLFPGEWYDAIPVGFEMLCISGETVRHRPYPRRSDGSVDPEARRADGGHFTDDDIRYGCLAFGVRAAT